jgi:hypothetical protein
MSEKRFSKGDKIILFSVLLEELGKNNWIYLRDRPIHPEMVKNMSLNTLMGAVQKGILYKAIDSKEQEVNLVFFKGNAQEHLSRVAKTCQ